MTTGPLVTVKRTVLKHWVVAYDRHGLPITYHFTTWRRAIAYADALANGRAG